MNATPITDANEYRARDVSNFIGIGDENADTVVPAEIARQLENSLVEATRLWTTPGDRLTSDECVELADEMLGRWFAFRERYAQTTCHHCGMVIDRDWAREHDNLCIVCSAKQNGPDKGDEINDSPQDQVPRL